MAAAPPGFCLRSYYLILSINVKKNNFYVLKSYSTVTMESSFSTQTRKTVDKIDYGQR